MGEEKTLYFCRSNSVRYFICVQWQMNAENGTHYNFWYFLVFSVLFIFANTIFSTPLIGLGYEMTSDYKERTRLMGFSQTIGQIAWMIVPWFGC
jgi:glycoside/pentoside/hexuronide:cation symporter, GPH family